MPRGIPSFDAEQKTTVISRVKDNGEKVADLAKEYGVDPKVIYRLLGNQTQNASAYLELAKVKKENESLLKIIGRLVAANEAGKKNKYGGGH